MKRILHMTPPFINNGVYRYLFNHMQYIDQQRYRFSFLTKNPAGLCETKEFEQYRFPVHAFLNVERDNPNGLRDEIARILAQGYDAIHLHTSYWRGFLIEQIAMEMEIPQVIVHSHSTGIDEIGGEDRSVLLEKHNMFKAKFSMEYATDVCACSKLAGEWLYGERIPREKIQILPNAIDIRRYHFCPQVRQKKRDELGLSSRVIVGNIGRYSYQKNQEFLLRTFAKARVYNPSLFLLFLGEGKQLGELKELADRLEIGKDVCFLGWQDDVEDYLQAMDVFCLPSRFEGLPISAVEAQTAGLKCLISDNVTKEVQITNLVTFLALEEMRWVEELAGCRIASHRDRQDEEISEAGYDIRLAARRLEALYERGK